MSKNKTFRVMTKVLTSEFYDGATHAVITVDAELVNFLFRKALQAKQMAVKDVSFRELTFNHYGAEFLDFREPDRVGLSEEEFEYCMDSCCSVIVPEDFEITRNDIANIQPMSLHVSADGFYWSGWDKYVGTNGYVETSRFSLDDLVSWDNEVCEYPTICHGGLTWYGLQKLIAAMPREHQSDNVTVLSDDEFYKVEGKLGISLEDDVLDKGHQFLILSE